MVLATMAPAGHAIDPNRAMSQYVRDRFGIEQGFPRGPVYAIAQTPDGYLWIGTEAGLVRFDGRQFKLIKDMSGTSGATAVVGLAEDQEGRLWVRLRDLTLRRYHDGIFDSRGLEKMAGITAMTRSARGEIVIWKMEDGAYLSSGETFHRLGAVPGMPRSPVIAIAHTGDGSTWVGTRDAGLFRPEGETASGLRKGMPDPKINCLLEAGGDLWIGTDDGIARWNGSALTGGPAQANHFQALAMVKDRDGNVWAGTDSRGLLRFTEQGVASIEDGKHAAEAITAVFEDREGNLWTGSASGIERIRDSAFVTYSLPEGVPSDGSNPVFAGDDGRTWFGSVSGGLWWFRNEARGNVDSGGLKQDVVYSIAGAKDELWVGRKHGGLSRLRLAGGGFSVETYTQAEGLAQNSVYSVYPARDGSVWAGTLSGGASRFSKGRFTTYTMAGGLASNTIASILETADGVIWFATPNGLSRLSNGRWDTFRKRDGLPSDNVNCLLEDAKGVLWAGTAAGLAFGDGHGFRVPRGAPGWLSEQVLGLAEDRSGSLWLSTSNHVLRVNRERLVSGPIAGGDWREFGLADGLRGVEGVKRHRSVTADSVGRIWFSMNRGISVVDPARFSRSSAPPLAQIQTVSADGAEVDLLHPIAISARRHRVTFGFAGLGLAVPERVRFRYALDGFDEKWSDATAAREANYTNLAPGSYRFHVQASDTDGLWSGAEAALRFDVTPLVWQRWDFRIGCALAIGLAGLAVYRLRLKQLTRQLDLRYEERLAERTRIAQELHDTLLQGFVSASMQLHVAAAELEEHSAARPRLDRVRELVAQVIEEGRNAVRGLRSARDGSADLGDAFARIPEELGFPSGAGFRVIVEGEPRTLPSPVREEVYRIGREALVNAFRHSEAKKIELQLEYSANRLRILVRDNGRGIDPRQLQAERDGHWGMRGMRERSERIGAKFAVWASANAGTEIELSVPAQVAYGTGNGTRPRWRERFFGRQ
jgi:signal transduction histidine kinase